MSLETLLGVIHLDIFAQLLTARARLCSYYLSWQSAQILNRMAMVTRLEPNLSDVQFIPAKLMIKC